jgi:hypothetical protein
VTCLHCPLCDNGSINMFPRQQIGTKQLATLLKAVFSMRFVLNLYNEDISLVDCG